MNVKGASPVPWALDLLLRVLVGVLINIVLKASVTVDGHFVCGNPVRQPAPTSGCTTPGGGNAARRPSPVASA